MSTGTRRWLVPLLAALAVLAIVAVLWAQRPGAGGGDVGYAGGGDSGQGSPPSAGTEPGSPGSPGVVEPLPPADGAGSGGGGGAGDGSGTVDAGSIAVTSFYSYDATHLAVNYTNGVPECYGKAGVPRVEESMDAVVVTIPRIPVKHRSDRVCIDIALLSSLDITLDAPLAGRPVLDGARGRAEVEEAAAPFSSDQAK
jgi:hypothetical protein